MTTPTLTPSRDLDARIMGLLGLTMSMVLEVPHYSTDMNAAVALVKAMSGYLELLYEDDLWHVSYAGYIHESADTPAMAICKAFLASKGEE